MIASSEPFNGHISCARQPVTGEPRNHGVMVHTNPMVPVSSLSCRFLRTDFVVSTFGNHVGAIKNYSEGSVAFPTIDKAHLDLVSPMYSIIRM